MFLVIFGVSSASERYSFPLYNLYSFMNQNCTREFFFNLTLGDLHTRNIYTTKISTYPDTCTPEHLHNPNICISGYLHTRISTQPKYLHTQIPAHPNIDTIEIYTYPNTYTSEHLHNRNICIAGHLHAQTSTPHPNNPYLPTLPDPN